MYLVPLRNQHINHSLGILSVISTIINDECVESMIFCIFYEQHDRKWLHRLNQHVVRIMITNS